MSAAAVLAVIVAVGEAHTPVTDALVGAAKEAVGSAASVQVMETRNQSDPAVLRVEASLDALAAVALVWDDDQHLHAHTRLHVARSDRWTSRDIVFEPADRPLERGRALGFTIASMLPEAGADIEITLPESFVRRERPTKYAVQVTLLGAGLTGPVGVGGAVAGELKLTERLAVRAGVTFRQASIQDTNAQFDGTELVFGAAAGLCLWLIPPSFPDQRLGLALRADLMGVRLSVDEGGSGSSPSHIYPGADLAAQATLRVASGVDIVLDLGVETVFAPTQVVIRDTSSSQTTVQPTIPAWQPVAEAGMRFLF